jgi:universal stress protein E
VDVLLVRQNHRGPFRRVTACIDFSAASARALDAALALAAVEGCPVDALHVHVPVTLNDMALEPFPAADTAEMTRVREELAARQLADFLTAFTTGREGSAPNPVLRVAASATDGIVEALEESGADLVALGTRGRTGLKILLLGTTAERLP